jgi:hypothetical protein
VSGRINGTGTALKSVLVAFVFRVTPPESGPVELLFDETEALAAAPEIPPPTAEELEPT